MTGPVTNPPLPTQNLPRQTARQTEMVRFYPVRNQKLKQWVTLSVVILLLLAAAVSLLYGLFATWNAVARYGRAVVLKTLPAPLLVAIATFVIGLVLLIIAIHQWNAGIELNPSGLVFKNGRSSKTVTWDSITRLDARVNVRKFATSVMDIQSRAEIETDRGETFQITDRIADSKDLIKRCREKVLPRLFHKSQEAIRQGKQIVFHRELAAVPQALLIRNMPYYWQDIEPVFKRKKLALQEKASKRELISLPINQLENADILLTLLENPPR